MMTNEQFVAIWLGTLVVIAACRILPVFALRGRALPPNVVEALDYIPPPAFAALVANDLFSPAAFAASTWQGVMPLVAAAVVVLVAWKTRSMLWCCVCGVAAYVLLGLI